MFEDLDHTQLDIHNHPPTPPHPTHTDTHTHTPLTSYQLVAQTATYTTQYKHNIRISMPSDEFEPAISEIKELQLHLRLYDNWNWPIYIYINKSFLILRSE